VRILRGIDYFTAGAQPPQPLPLVRNRTLAPAVFFTTGASAIVTSRLSLLGRVGRNKQSDSNINPVPGLVLEPEQQTKWEAGVEGRVASMLTATVTAFHRGVQNEKSISGYSFTRNNGTQATCVTTAVPATGAAAPATSLQPCYAQSDTTRNGVEFVVEGGWNARGHYRAGFTRMTALEDSANVAQRTTPRNVIDLSVTQGWQLFSATASIKRVARFEGRRPGGGGDTAYYPLGEYTRVDASLGRSFPVAGSVYRATVYGRNLGNVRYHTVAGYPDVGRVIGADLTLTF
jgi:outer membrane cobalamin receptor